MKITKSNRKREPHVKFVCNDPFHPGQLHTVVMVEKDIQSHQFMGYGTLNNIRTPVQRLIFINGTAEDVFDVEYSWPETR